MKLAVVAVATVLAVNGFVPVVAEPMQSAIVVFAAQADTGAPFALGRRQRAAAIERRLRDQAWSAQRDVLRLLASRQRQHVVSRFEPLWILNAISVTATPSVLHELAARPEIARIRPELRIAAAFSASTPAPAEANVGRVNAPALWSLGFRGQGVVVATLDTGVDASHPDLAGRWRGGTNSWYDPNGQHPTTPTDVDGHGTATMGVLVGGDAGGTSIGVAPDARWIAAKVFNDSGIATATAVHKAMQWLLDPDGNPASQDAPDVVNNSWTLSAPGCNVDFQLDLRSLRGAGILPIFSAGNYGPAPGTVYSPANNPEAFSVGAVDAADAVDPSSGRGPSACGQPTAPDLVAPGVDVRTTDLYGLYANRSGTSLAAPHVAGALALLLSAFPDTAPDRQAAALRAGALDLGPPGADNDSGSGRLDVVAAYHWLATTPDFAIAATPSSASVQAGGSLQYTIIISRANGFAGAVGLSLTGLDAAQWSFAPLADDTAVLTVTTAATIPGGTYSLRITGTSGATTRTTYVTLLVPDFTLAVTPASRTILVGGATTYSVNVGSLGGFGGAVSLSVTGLPAGATATFSRNPVTAPGAAVLTVRTSATTPRGTYTLRVRQASVSLIVR